MILGEIPDLRAAVAYECRTSWSRILGSPAAVTCLWNSEVSVSGCRGVPSGRTGTADGWAAPAAQPFLSPHLDITAQRLEGPRVERHHAVAGLGLRVGLSDLAVDRDPRRTGGDPCVLEVDVGAEQPGEFAAPHAVVAASIHSAKNRSLWTWSRNWRISSGSQTSRVSRADRGRLRVVGGVAGRHVPADGVAECPVQHPVDVHDGLGSQATLAPSPPVLKEVAVEQVQSHRGEVLQRGLANVGDQAEPHVVAIVDPGGRSHADLHSGVPLLEELPDRSPRGADRPVPSRS